MSVSQIVRKFELSTSQVVRFKEVAKDKARLQLAEQLYKSAIATPGALADCRAQLLAMLEPIQPGAIAAAPTAPAPARAIAFVWSQASGVAAYIPGQPIAPGSKVCYVGDEQAAQPWQDYAPAATAPSAPAAPAAPVVKTVETRINTTEAQIPLGASGYRLPYVTGANVSTDGKFYAQFGLLRGQSFNRASMPLDELIELLASPAHVADMLRTLREYKARLGG